MATPVCFMIMPFRTKKTGAEPPHPAEIDFDALWTRALEPAIKELGYSPVRADQDLGALIIKEMIERLALSDLVMADITVPNGNVYYEVGVRHAAAERGCVLLAAEWARPLFDVDQMRQVRYPLAAGTVDDVAAKAVRDAVLAGAAKLKDGVSPVFQALPGYPPASMTDGATAFAALMDEIGEFRAALAAVGNAPEKQRPAKALALRDRFGGKTAMVPFVVIELLYLLRDHVGWKEVKEYIDGLPDNLRGLTVIREQRCLAQAKLGDAAGAIGAYEELVRTLGDSADRQGMIGGRYKQLHQAALDAKDEREAARCLDKAIEHYERGMNLDLNEYYPSSNLPRLLRMRKDDGDAERAARVAVVAAVACERARLRSPNDPWVRPTLLGALFDEGNEAGVRRVVKEIKRDGVVAWRLETTIADLDRSLLGRPAGDAFIAIGRALIDDLRALLPR